MLIVTCKVDADPALAAPRLPVRRVEGAQVVDRKALAVIVGPAIPARVVDVEPVVVAAHVRRGPVDGLGVTALEDGRPAVTNERLAAVARDRESDELEVGDLRAELEPDVVHVERVADRQDHRWHDAVVVKAAGLSDVEHGLLRYAHDLRRPVEQDIDE